MKHIYLIICLFMLFFATSCESKFDSDDLAGNWQLVEWTDGETTVKQGGLYYAFQLGLMQLRLYPSDKQTYLSRFQHQGNELILTNIIVSDNGGFNDEILDVADFSLLHDYGVPLNGKFRIENLNDDRLVLTADNLRLVFRKY